MPDPDFYDPFYQTLWLYTPETRCFVVADRVRQQVLRAAFYGYGCYTSWKWGVDLFFLTQHFNRLRSNAVSLNLSLDCSENDFQNALQAMAVLVPSALKTTGSLACRLTLVPNIQDYGSLLRSAKMDACLLLSFRKSPVFSGEPLKLKIVSYQRPFATLKLNAMAEPLLFRQQALSEGFHDVLFINPNQTLSEASTANIFVFSNHLLKTPHPKRDYCLPGITRQAILTGMQTVQTVFSATETTPITLQESLQADGIFLSNAVQGLIPVGQINDTPIPFSPLASQVFQQLKAALP
jgi:branched-subunit amino acid aminotransferase/4-amino-4-deoxychorismate lyase